jgi:hypothetical protein
MTINVSINGNKLFDWTGDAEEVREIDKWVRKVARKKGVTPDLVAQAALFGALKKGRPQIFTRGDAILIWKLLSGPTGRPDAKLTSGRDMDQVFKNIRLFMRETGGTILITHTEASYVLLERVDVMIEVIEWNPAAGFIRLRHLKNCHGPVREFAFGVKTVKVDGEAVSIVTGEFAVEGKVAYEA